MHNEAQQKREVAVLGGEAAEQHAKAQGQGGDEQHEYRGQKRVQIRVYRSVGENQVIREHQEKQPHLNAEPHEVAGDGGKRHHEPREVHLAEHVRILNERFAGLVQAFRKIGPQANARQVKERLRQAVCTDFRDAAEHDHEHDGGHDRLNEEPQRSKNSLFIPGDNVAFHEHAVQIAVLPKLAEVYREQARLWLNDGGPFACLCRGHLLSLECPFPHYVLRRLVDAYIDAAHVFADKPEQKHNHTAHKEERGQHAGIAHGNFGEHQFLVNNKDTRSKPYQGTDNAYKSSCTERLYGECRKTVDPEPDESRERVAGCPFDAAAVLHLYVAQVLGSAENESADIGKGVWVAHDLVDDELAHYKETRGAERLGLANDCLGHFLVDPGTKAAEEMLRGMFVVAVHHVVAFFQFVYKFETFAGGGLAVVIKANHVIASGLPVASHQGAVLAEVLGKADSLDAAVFASEALDDLPYAVGAAVVHQHDFVVCPGSRRDGVADFLHHCLDGVFATVAGYYERKLHTFSHLLLCAERAAACIIERPSREVRMPQTYWLSNLPVAKNCPRQSAMSL